MGQCVPCTLVVLTVVKVASAIVRIVFDALGSMWLPLSVNLLDLLLSLLAVHGIVSKKMWPFALWIPWSIIWIMWNFIVCLAYQNVLNLNLFQAVLTLGLPGSLSWWYSHGLRCTVEPIAISLTSETRTNYATRPPLQVHTPPTSLLSESFQEVLPSSSPSLRPVVVTPNPTIIALDLLYASDARVWLQPANKIELGQCWPDYRIVETVQAALQILFAVLLLFFCILLIIRLRKTRKLELCRADFTFLAMPRDRPSEKFAYHPLSTNNTLTSRPLSSNGPAGTLVANCLARDTPQSNRKAGSVTATQSTSSDHTESDSNSRVPSSAAALQPSHSTVVVFPPHRRLDAREEEEEGKASLNGTWSEPTKSVVRILRTDQPFRANISTGRPRGFSPLPGSALHPVSGSQQNLACKQHHPVATLSDRTTASDIGCSRYRIAPASSACIPSLVESSAAAPAATTPRQLAQLQEYSRRIAKITRSREARFSSSSSESQERRRYPGLLAGGRINPSSGHASSPTTTTTTTTDTSSVFSAMDRSDQLLLNQRQQAQRNLSLADVIHPRQQSAPAAEAVGTTDSSGSSKQIFRR